MEKEKLHVFDGKFWENEVNEPAFIAGLERTVKATQKKDVEHGFKMYYNTGEHRKDKPTSTYDGVLYPSYIAVGSKDGLKHVDPAGSLKYPKYKGTKRRQAEVDPSGAGYEELFEIHTHPTENMIPSIDDLDSYTIDRNVIFKSQFSNPVSATVSVTKDASTFPMTFYQEKKGRKFEAMRQSNTNFRELTNGIYCVVNDLSGEDRQDSWPYPLVESPSDDVVALVNDRYNIVAADFDITEKKVTARPGFSWDNLTR